jgi:tRNA threonylcarbamoyladenosine biosynthesis protein TsaB
MKILALDTSSNVAAAAVMEDSVVLGEYSLNHGKKHSEKLMPMIAALLKDLDLSPHDMDLFAVSSGPGSFTGLRIGITTVKAMAYVCKKPVVSIPTPDVLACNVPVHNGLVCPMSDARNRQVYTAIYKQEGTERRRISEYMGVNIAELADILKEESGDIIFTGNGADMHRKYLLDELGGRAYFTPRFMSLQSASCVAFIAERKFLAGETEDCFDVVPFYLRKSQAEREYEKKFKGLDRQG